MHTIKIVFVAISAVLLANGCTPKVPASPGPTVPTSAAPASAEPTSTSVVQPSKTGPVAPGGLLVEIRTAHYADRDQVTFIFGGTTAPELKYRYVTEVRQDPSDRLVHLLGSKYLVLVFDGGTLDTSPRETDIRNAQRYTGPKQITPGLPLLKEVVAIGDFEGVLSFGVGLARVARVQTQTSTGPARVVVDFWYT